MPRHSGRVVMRPGEYKPLLSEVGKPATSSASSAIKRLVEVIEELQRRGG